MPGGKLSAPRLLCLNAPALVAARRVFQALPRLRQVLLLVEDVPAPAASAAVTTRPVVRGTLTLQQLEEQLSQQSLLEEQQLHDDCSTPQLGAQQQPGAAVAAAALPRQAVEALLALLLSCMDRVV